MIRLLTGAAAIWLCSSVIWAQQPAPLQPRGVAPRSTPADYTAHVSINGVTYAASLLSPAEVKHAFAFDISRSYVVSRLPYIHNHRPESISIQTASLFDPHTRASRCGLRTP